MISVSLFTISDLALLGKSQHQTPAVLSRELLLNGYRINNSFTLSTRLENLSEYIKISDSDIYFFMYEGNTENYNNLNQFIANKLSVSLEDNQTTKEEVLKYFKEVNIPLGKEDENLWKLPSKSRAIISSNGRAHGYITTGEGKKFIVLPLNFYESEKMIKNTIIPYLVESSENKYKTAIFKTFGISGEDIKEVLKDVIKNKDKVSISIFSSILESDIIIKTRVENAENLSKYSQMVFDKLNKFIYAEENISLYQAAYNLLKLNNLTIAFAESITGGEITSNFIKNNYGASKVIKEGIVTYTNPSKIERLGVSAQTLDKHSDVSAETTYEMATGLLKTSKADVVLTTTGYASSDDPKYPLGLCYIAIGDAKEIHVYKNQFSGTREEVIESVTKAGYFYLIKKLRKNDFHFEKTTV